MSRSLEGAWYEVREGRLAPSSGSDRDPEPVATLVHDQFRAMISSAAFPCLGARGAVRRDDYGFGLYPPLGSAAAIAACGRDLERFITARPATEHPVSAFVAAFDGPAVAAEAEFEDSLWALLRGLAERDPAEPLATDEYLDPSDPGFCFAHREFFVVGFNPSASRWARRFGWPLLVFNALTHSVPLHHSGKYHLMRERILDRDRKLQGFDNPSLHAPQVAQFSGREVPPGPGPPVAGS